MPAIDERTVPVPTISCAHCVGTIERELRDLAGVTTVSADADTKRVTVKWEAPATWQQIADLLVEIGYPAGE